MSGTVKVTNVQLGDSATATNNFVLSVPATPDGTVKLSRGNVGATTQDVLTIDANGQVFQRGTATNDDAPAGYVGEYIESAVPAGSAIALSTSVAANVTSISLTPGDWEVTATVLFKPTATTNVTGFVGQASATSAGLTDESAQFRQFLSGGTVPALDCAFSPRLVRFKITAPTTIYLVAFSYFTVSTMGAYGTIAARRVR